MTSRESIYTCKFCEKQVHGLKFVKKHQNVCSSNPDNKDKPFKCVDCNHSYNTNGNLHKHNQTCPSNSISNSKVCCEFCTKQFTSIGITHHTPHCHLNPNSNKYEPDRKLKESKDCVEFIDNKYTKLYFKIINSTTSDELLGYTEKHHIVPRSFGGSDDKSNLVKLSARKHYVCHLLLTKMVQYNSPEYHKMIKAYVMMANSNGVGQSRVYKVNSKLYESLRTEFANQQSISQSGVNNNQYGKIWAYNPSTKENRLIKPDDIEDGWVKGKVVNWDTHFTQLKCKECSNIGRMSKLSMFCSKSCRVKHTNRNDMGNSIIQNKTLIELINERSTTYEDCILWQKSVTTYGLPQYVFKGKNIQVHKYIYEQNNNTTIGKGYVVKQTCGNTRCINPHHLILKTLSEHHNDNKESYDKVNNAKSKDWIINGITYKSIRSASKSTGISQSTIYKYTKNGIFDINAYHDGYIKRNMTPKI